VSDPQVNQFTYRADVRRALLGHGVCPTPGTPPELVRGFVRELYKYEIRMLKSRLMRGEFPRREYTARVEALRDRYAVLSLLPRQFLA
jgi:hypothetical protein